MKLAIHSSSWYAHTSKKRIVMESEAQSYHAEYWHGRGFRGRVFFNHMASEIVQRMWEKQLRDCAWPSYDPALIAVTTATIVGQVNGKMRAALSVPCKMT